MRRVVALALALAPALAFAQLRELESPGAVSAVQDRAFRMQHELGLSIGLLPQDAFYKGLTVKGAYGFHFTDSFAAEGYFSYSYNLSTGLRQQLERDFGVLPTAFDEVQFFVGSDLMWKPLYGKLSVMNRWVLHGEMYLLAGASVFRFTNAFRFGPNLGGGARLFINKYASIRFDLTDNIVLPTGGATSLINVMTITLGLGINFGGTE